MSDSLEEIKSPDGTTLAIIVSRRFRKDGINFISKSDFPLQVGINSYEEGEEIAPHVHKDREITINRIQEVLYMKSGGAVLSLYDTNRELFKSYTLAAGDLIFLIAGGHGFKMLKDTTIIEVKQGPYLGKDKDKALIT